MPAIAPKRERISEIQVMFPTFADLPIASERGDVVNGLMHVATYIHTGTIEDTIGRIFPKVLKATKNRWEGTEFIPWFNDPNVKLTHDGLKLITEGGGLRDLRKGDAIRLVGSGYKEEGRDVEFYHTEGKTVATYLYDGESFRTTQRRLVVDYAITLEDEPEPEPEAEEAPVEEPAAERPDEAKDGPIEVGDHVMVPATASPNGLPLEGMVVSVSEEKIVIQDEAGKRWEMSLKSKEAEAPASGEPAAPADAGSSTEGRLQYENATFEEVRKGDEVIVVFEENGPVARGTVIEKDPEGMFIKDGDAPATPVVKSQVKLIRRRVKEETPPANPPAGGADAEAPVAPQPSPQESEG